MSKHEILMYPKILNVDDECEYDYADGSFKVKQNHRPIVGDVVVNLQDGYPYSILIVKTLILLREDLSTYDETSYWHAYCDSVDFDFSLRPYYGKSDDIAKLAAHAVAQRADFGHKYGKPPEWYDIDTYKNKCKDSIKELIDKQG